MDLSALQRDVNVLEISLDSIEAWITIATFLVVAGLLIEYWFPLSELVQAYRKRPPFPWKAFTEMIGGVLVTIGVTGELLFQSRASVKQASLRSATHQVESILNKQASDANVEAAAARKETESIRRDTMGFSVQLAAAKKDSADANALAKKYEAGIAEANARAKGAEAQVASANAIAKEAVARAEAEALERMSLEARVAPRSLSIEQQRLIIAALRKFSGHPRVILSSYGLDGEGAALGEQLISVLTSAGISVSDQRAQSISTGGFENGVHIRGPASENEFLSGLYAALSSTGKLAVFVNGPTVRSGTVLTGSASMRGSTTISGGGGVVNVPVPPGTPVSIMVGVKPVPMLIAK